jgi:ferredoxin
MPHSCGNGICGSCKTKMLEGNVNMTLNLGLTEEDKSGQYILPCVSYAVTEKIKLLLE